MQIVTSKLNKTHCHSLLPLLFHNFQFILNTYLIKNLSFFNLYSNSFLPNF